MRAAAAAEQLQQMEIQMEDSAEDLGPVGTGRVYGRAEGTVLHSCVCVCVCACVRECSSLVLQSFSDDEYAHYATLLHHKLFIVVSSTSHQFRHFH